MKYKAGIRGLTLIEILVALVVLSIGLLGLLKLHFVATSANQGAAVRSQALLVAQSLADRMRANRQYINRSHLTQPVRDAASDNAYSSAGNYNFANISTACSGDPWTCFCTDWPSQLTQCRDETASTGTTSTVSTPCQADELAVFDAYEMSCAAVAADPSMWLQVDCQDLDTNDSDACSANSKHTITLSWLREGLRLGGADSRHCPDRGDGARDCVVVELMLGGQG